MKNPVVDLDLVSRAQIVTAGCVQLYNSKRTSEIGSWRMKMADADLPALLFAVSELGVILKSGGAEFKMPVSLPMLRWLI